MILKIRDIQSGDFPVVVEMNLASEHFLSPLSPERLGRLHSRAAYAKVMEEDGKILAFLLAFREKADYDSPNYLWFADRYDNFLYIDRIVVRENRRGEGIAGTFYRDLVSFALRSGVKVIACEVDILPPNPVSREFHRNRGFIDVGTLRPYGGAKQVALMVKRLAGGS